MTPEFEWDAQKAVEHVKNHGVEFDEALTVFARSACEYLR
jgi:uncharacterized DUF497 family protein